MEETAESLQLVEKLFDQALKMKISQLARKYDPNLVFDLWAQIATKGGSKAYYRRWNWKPDMTLLEALRSLDDHLNGLQELLPKLQGRKVKKL
jgi:hypothetical protein